LRSSVAFCPAGISSFFEPCTRDTKGKPLNDPAKIGARGGGFVISSGVTARVVIRKRHQTRIKIRINSKQHEASTTRAAISQLLSDYGLALNVDVDIRVEVPIAAGFGTSAAGTLASCFAVTDAADLPVTFNQVGVAAHVAEVLNGTGLGTVSALLCGGFVLVREPGAPGVGLVDRLRFPSHHSLLCAYLGPIHTREALFEKGQEVERRLRARCTIETIIKSPTLPVFLTESRKFGRRAGFETQRISRLISTMISVGAVGAAQNMIGEAVHAVVEDSKVKEAVITVRKAFPEANVFASRIEDRGVRFLKENANH